MAKLSKDDYSAIATALSEHVETMKTQIGPKMTDDQLAKVGKAIALKNQVIAIRDTPAKPRGKAAQNGAAAVPAKAGAKK